MVSILLAWNEEAKAKALAAGFREVAVLLRHNGCQSTEENKRQLEMECRELRPFQFLVADFWGACLD